MMGWFYITILSFKWSHLNIKASSWLALIDNDRN